jgi:hypothetical protein
MPTTYAIPDGRTVMAATLYTGTGSALSANNAINGVSFQPDMVWYKQRASATSTSHCIQDVIRGVSKVIVVNGTVGDQTISTYLTAFNSNGFSMGTGSGADPNDVNTNGYTYVGWNWKAGGTGVSNTAGTITSTVSANTTAGFSIVTYTSTTGTVGHGLGVAPSMIIMKGTNVSDQWTVGMSALNGGSSPWNYGLPLNSNAALQTNSGFWNNTAPTSTVFSQGSWDSGYTKVAYCFAAVAGYSAFGTYTGNGSADGPFIYTGFRPRWLMTKRTDSSSSGDWNLVDTSRATYNAVGPYLYANLSNAEGSAAIYDILSNGFKIRESGAGTNASGSTYIYAAFAENPFKYANAR